jgi:lipopolysaccharide/colanic/teichoic acid biosynthesis glycosyltransferase
MSESVHGVVLSGEPTVLGATDVAAVSSDARQSGLGLVMKRVIDVVGALFGLILLSPVFALVAVIIKLDSKGPVFFCQERLGKNGRPFTFYKFRTMEHGNDPAIHREYVTSLIQGESEELKGETGAYKIELDPRVTRFGHYLRRTSVDELPQLINVVRGEMSLVGPRPPIGYEVDLYGVRERRRLDVMPGITGLWQVSGRSQKSYREMVDLDLRYIDEWSVLGDLKILAQTVSVVLGRKGAW